MKFRLLLLLTFATGLTTFAQTKFNADKLSAEGKAILADIADERTVPSDTMGLRFQYLPKDFPLTRLRERLSIEELVELTKHKKAIVRCYGFKALTQRSETRAFEVVVNHLQDAEEIETHYGCFGMTMAAGDFFVNVFRGYEAIAHDSLHLNTLDSLIIFTPNKLNERDEAVRRAGKRLIYYDKIREIAIEEKLAGAIIALGGFRRPEDISIIMHTKVASRPSMSSSLSPNFIAIYNFPHPDFLPFLERNFQTLISKPPHTEITFLSMAIANYNTSEASNLLSRVFQIPVPQLKNEHLEQLSRILRRNSNPIYNDLRTRIEVEIKNQ